MESIAISKTAASEANEPSVSKQPDGKYIVKDQDVAFKQTKSITAKQQKSLWTSVGMIVSLVMVIAAFEWKTYEVEELVNLGTLDAEFEEILDIPLTQQEPPPPVKELIPPEIIEVPDEEEIEEEIEVNIDAEVTEETVIEEVVFEEAPEEEVSEEIFDIVEEQASPVGGMNSFFEYFSKSLKYPIPARKAGVEGKVYVQFVVTKAGDIGQIKILKGIGYGCDQEAVRVVKGSPKWNPAKQRGKPVNSRVTLPLVFKLT